ncbi:hypothetical protein HDV01_005660 [Terramyces sp. JEL0728]|nr:hypothetical protein HDV01_005660 [Terramyces sp. JEL0728]
MDFEKFFEKPFVPAENPENGSFLGNPKDGFGPILGPCISTTKYDFEQEAKTMQKVTLDIPDSILPKKGKGFVGWESPPVVLSGNYNTPRGFLEQVNNLDNEVQQLLNSKEEKATPLVRKAFNPKDFIKKEQQDNMEDRPQEEGGDRRGRDRGKRERTSTKSNSPPRKKSKNSPIKDRRDERDGRKRQISDPDSIDAKKEPFKVPPKEDKRDDRKRDQSPTDRKRDYSPRSDKSVKNTPKEDKSIKSTPRDDSSLKNSPKDKPEENPKTPKDKLGKSFSIPAFVPNADVERGIGTEPLDWNHLGKAHKRFADDNLGGKAGNVSTRIMVHYTAALLSYYSDLANSLSSKEYQFLNQKKGMEDYRAFAMKKLLANPKFSRFYSLVCYCEGYFLAYQYQLLQNNVKKYNSELGKVLKLEDISDKERISNFEIKQKKLTESIRDSENIFEKVKGIYSDAYKYDPKMQSPFYGKPLSGTSQHGTNGMGRARAEFVKLANEMGYHPCFIKEGARDDVQFIVEKDK